MPRRAELLIPPVTVAVVVAILAGSRKPAQHKPPTGPDGPAAVKLSAEDSQRVMRRVFARDRVAQDVADGRRSVFAAAALFRALDQAAPPFTSPPTAQHVPRGLPLPVEFPATTPDEVYCRQVVYWTFLVLRAESPTRAEALARRLTDQVRAEIRAKGAITLADPAGLADEAEQLITETKWLPTGPFNSR